MKHPKRNHRSGMSIAEVGLAAMLVGVVTIACLEVATAIYRTHRVSVEMATGPALAHALMSEIVSMPFDDPDEDAPSPSTNRSHFRTIDHFLNTETEIASRDGTPLDDYDAWEQEIDVLWISPETGQVSNADTGLKKMAVSVFKPADRERTEVILEAYRSRNGLLEQPLFQDCTLVTWVGAQLQLATTTRPGASGTGSGLSNAVYSGTPLHNHVAEAVEEE